MPLIARPHRARGLVIGSGVVQAGSGSGWSRFLRARWPARLGAHIRHAWVTGSLSWEGASNDLSRRARWRLQLGGWQRWVLRSVAPRLRGGWGRWRWSWLQVPR